MIAKADGLLFNRFEFIVYRFLVSFRWNMKSSYMLRCTKPWSCVTITVHRRKKFVNKATNREFQHSLRRYRRNFVIYTIENDGKNEFLKSGKTISEYCISLHTMQIKHSSITVYKCPIACE